jgi:hypothetical protein
MRQRKLVKAFYGRVAILKRFCPDCHMYAFVISNKFGCCGKVVGDWDQEFYVRKKRESETDGRRHPISPKDKARILRHQLHQCVYCGQSFGRRVHIEYDHFIPFCYSGDNDRLNMVAACRECNQIKNDRLFLSIEEARVYILAIRENKRLPIMDYYGGSYEVSQI